MSEWLSRWARFFEMRLPDGSLPVMSGVALAWSPAADGVFWRQSFFIFLYFFLVLMFIHGSDAIVGYVRGVDRIVYERGGVVKEPKLLVTGEVSLRQALAATGLMTALLIATGIYLGVTLDRLPFLLSLVVGGFAAQYSVGLCFSYRGLGEAVIFSTGLTTPVAFIALTGEVACGPIFVGAVLGLFFAGVNLNSNQADYPYDKAAGRGTLAVRVGLRAHRVVGLILAILCWVSFAAALATGSLPLYTLFPGSYLIYRHGRQIRLLFAGEPIRARKTGFITFRMLQASLLLCIVLDKILGTP